MGKFSRNYPVGGMQQNRPPLGARCFTCWNCNQTVVPSISSDGGGPAGYLGVPVGDQQIFAPIRQAARFSYRCPSCGAPFEDDEKIRELNGDMSPDQWRGIWMFLGVLFAVVLTFIVGIVVGGEGLLQVAFCVAFVISLFFLVSRRSKGKEGETESETVNGKNSSSYKLAQTVNARYYELAESAKVAAEQREKTAMLKNPDQLDELKRTEIGQQLSGLIASIAEKSKHSIEDVAKLISSESDVPFVLKNGELHITVEQARKIEPWMPEIAAQCNAIHNHSDSR